ncbi:uncharacterized protein LOC102804351 [Saccoglossus kowalevskii]|uniref:Uncharacterized protein LOC102804351 n=1 Tax=Saccoglossus kowalevskii TaxID=10224 RepID=A0ABM0LW25_SACKO|nr:PREDICTED: uncharacterized protein LOC102804351 [Saccoglossus kowalevskii]
MASQKWLRSSVILKSAHQPLSSWSKKTLLPLYPVQSMFSRIPSRFGHCVRSVETRIGLYIQPIQARLSLLSQARLFCSSLSNTVSAQNGVIWQINQMDSLESLVDFVHINGNKFDEEAVVSAVRRMAEIVEVVRQDDQFNLWLMNLGPVCDLVMMHARYMTNINVTLCLYNFSKCEVPLNTPVMQTLLRQCEARMNDMDLESLTRLRVTLGKMPKTEQVDAMILATQILCKQTLNRTLSIRLLASLIEPMYNVLSPSEKREFDNRIVAIMTIRKDVKLKHVVNLFRQYGYVRHRSDVLLEKASQLIMNSDDVTAELLESVLVACERLKYYNDQLFEWSARFLQTHMEDLTINCLARVLHVYAVFGYVHKPLLRQVADHIYNLSDISPLDATGSIDSLSMCAFLLAPFAELNFRQFTEFKSPLSEHAKEEFESSDEERYLCKLVEDKTEDLLLNANNTQYGHVLDVINYLTMLNKTPSRELLQFIFDPKCQRFLMDIKDNARFNRRRNAYLNIYRSLEMNTYDDLSHLSLETCVMQNRKSTDGIVDTRKVLQLSLQAIIRLLYGDKLHTEINILDYPGLIIDCKVDLKDSVRNNKRLALLLAPDSYYAKNLLEDAEFWLLGNAVAMERQLNIIGYHVRWIPLREWAVLETKQDKMEYTKSVIDNFYKFPIDD